MKQHITKEQPEPAYKLEKRIKDDIDKYGYSRDYEELIREAVKKKLNEKR